MSGCSGTRLSPCPFMLGIPKRHRNHLGRYLLAKYLDRQLRTRLGEFVGKVRVRDALAHLITAPAGGYPGDDLAGLRPDGFVAEGDHALVGEYQTAQPTPRSLSLYLLQCLFADERHRLVEFDGETETRLVRVVLRCDVGRPREETSFQSHGFDRPVTCRHETVGLPGLEEHIPQAGAKLHGRV